MSEIVSKDVAFYRKMKLGEQRPKLKNLFKLTELKPLPFQEKVINVIDKQYEKFHTLFLLASRRSSKSITTAHIAVLDLLTPQANVGLVCPTNKQLDVIFNEVLKILRKMGIKPISINSQQKTFKLENGSAFYGVSEKTVEQLEGLSLSLLIIDEVFLINDIDRILSSLSPAMLTYGTHPNGMRLAKTIMLGSLRKNKVAYEYYLRGERKEKGYISINYKATENPLFTPEMLQQERERIGEKEFRMQYLNEPVLFQESGVFYSFDYNKNTIDVDIFKSLIDKDSIIVTGLDVGASDNSSYVLVYVERGKYYVLDGFEINNVSEAKLAEMIKNIEEKWGVEPTLRFIDPSAKLTRIGLANDHNLIFYPAMNAIKESVGLLNQLFDQEKLYINKDMKELIQQIQVLEWKDTNVKSPDPFKRVKGHHFDYIAALRYAVYSHHKQEGIGEFVVI